MAGSNKLFVMIAIFLVGILVLGLLAIGGVVIFGSFNRAQQAARPTATATLAIVRANTPTPSRTPTATPIPTNTSLPTMTNTPVVMATLTPATGAEGAGEAERPGRGTAHGYADTGGGTSGHDTRYRCRWAGGGAHCRRPGRSVVHHPSAACQQLTGWAPRAAAISRQAAASRTLSIGGGSPNRPWREVRAMPARPRLEWPRHAAGDSRRRLVPGWLPMAD